MGTEYKLHRLFELSIILKGIFALIDLAGGLLLLIVGTNPFVQLLNQFSQGELVEDPNDHLANYFIHITSHYFPVRPAFLIVYLLIHGSINCILVIGLRRHRTWAYPFALSALSIFMTYQLYRLSLHFSIWLIILTILDLIVIGLVWREHKNKLHESL